MYEFARSVRYAGRGLARTPVFSLTVVVTLALAIGANSAVFSIVDRVFLRPLPFSEPDRLVYVTHADETSTLPVSVPPIRLLDWSERNSSFEPVTVVGVMPSEFAFVDADADLWSPLLVDAPFATSRQGGWFGGVVGRLMPEVSIEQAELDLRAVQAQLAREYPQTDSDLRITAVPYRDTVVGPFRGSLWLLFGAVSVLVLIACTNITALVLARAAHRQRDIAIRASLGASRAVLAAQALVETALLVLAGTAAGLLCAYGAVSVLETYTNDLPTFGGIEVDARVLVYTLVCALIVVLLCGLVPASRSASGTHSLSHAGRAEVSPRQTLNWTLVGAQVALSVTLLAGAGLLLRSFDSLARVDPGFEGDHVLTFTIHGSFSETNDPVAVAQRINRTIDELETLPGVEAVATANTYPGVSFTNQDTYAFVDWTPPEDVPVVAETRIVSPSYFAAVQMPLLRGELCRRPDGPAGSGQVMVNRAFAERYFGASPAIGRRLAGAPRTLGDGSGRPSRIVGVVGNAREISMHVDPAPTVYSCYSAPTPVPPFFARTTGDPMAIVESVRARLAEIEPLRSVYDFAPLSRRISDIYAQDRLRTVLLTLFSVAALALTCLGVHGTFGYVVSLRRREVGLRVALGALRSSIATHYLAKALKIVGIASLVGLALSVAFARFLSSMLYGASPVDPLTLATVVGVVVLVCTAAALVPAMRASRIDPMSALREE